MGELPSVAQMRPVTQPPTVIGRPSAEHWTARSTFVPFQRAYHSVELTLLALLAAIGDLALGGGLAATRVLVVGLLAAAAVTVLGHVAASLTSSKLR